MTLFRHIIRKGLCACTKRSPLLAHARFREAVLRTTRTLMTTHRVPHVDIAWRIGSPSRTLVGEERFVLSEAGVHRASSAEPRLAYRLSSVTKPVVALTTLALVRDGILDLDEPLDGLLEPVLAPLTTLLATPLASPLTLRRLLSHTAGLAEQNPPTREAALLTADPIAVWLATPEAQQLLRPLDGPTQRSCYSGMGYALAQYAIEERCGERLPLIVRASVLSPLDAPGGFEQELWGRDAHPVRTSTLSPTPRASAVAPDHADDGSVLAICPSVYASSSGFVACPHDVCLLMHRGLFGSFLPKELANTMLTGQPCEMQRGELRHPLFSLSLRLHGGGTPATPEPVDARSLTHAGLRAGHASVVVVVPEREAVLCVATSSRSGSRICKPLTGLFRELFVDA
jgi:CubicO group peptidase (beta-lactamase class C family)